MGWTHRSWTKDCLIVWTFSWVWNLDGLLKGFLLINKHVVLKFSTNRSINFLSRTASFWHNIKSEWKVLCITITDSPVLKNISTANIWCALFQAIIIIVHIRKKISLTFARWSYHYYLLKFAYTSSSSCRATSTDIPDPRSPLLLIVHHLWQVFRATSHILT